jgi:hypothetical protein
MARGKSPGLFDWGFFVEVSLRETWVAQSLHLATHALRSGEQSSQHPAS